MYTLMIVPTRHHGNAHNVLCCRHAIEMFEKFTTGNPDNELKRSISSSALMACSSSLGQNPPFQGTDSESNFFSYTSSFCHTYIYSHRMILILQNCLTKKETIAVNIIIAHYKVCTLWLCDLLFRSCSLWAVSFFWSLCACMRLYKQKAIKSDWLAIQMSREYHTVLVMEPYFGTPS